jgi:hypothetical protein
MNWLRGEVAKIEESEFKVPQRSLHNLRCGLLKTPTGNFTTSPFCCAKVRIHAAAVVYEAAPAAIHYFADLRHACCS